MLMAPVLLLLDMVSHAKETTAQMDIGAAQVSVQWAELFKLYATLGWVIGTVVIGWLLYNIVKYRSRPGLKQLEGTPKPGSQPSARGNIKATLILTVIVSSILFPLTAGTLSTVDLIEHPPQKEGMLIRVEAFQWGWKFTYPNGQTVLSEIRVPKGQVIIFEVVSNDVFHNFGLVGFKVKTDAIPGKMNRLWIDPMQTGIYNILCYEFCGVGHSVMKAKLIVMEPEEFNQWYRTMQP